MYLQSSTLYLLEVVTTDLNADAMLVDVIASGLVAVSYREKIVDVPQPVHRHIDDVSHVRHQERTEKLPDFVFVLSSENMGLSLGMLG